MALTKVTYSMIDGGIANVTDYGAVGDSVTDDSVSIQAAIDSGFPNIYFPPGNYIAEDITLISNVYLYGEGTITAKAGSSSFFTATNESNITFDGLTLIAAQGTNANNKTFSKNIITANTVDDLTFQNMTFDGAFRDFSDADGSVPSNTLEVLIDVRDSSKIAINNVFFIGYKLQSAGSPFNLPADFLDLFYRGVVVIRDSVDISSKDVQLSDENRGQGIAVLGSCSNIVIDHMYGANNPASNFGIVTPIIVYGADIKDVVIQNCFFEGNRGSGMNIWAPKNIKIVNNTFIGGAGIDFANEGRIQNTQVPDGIYIAGNYIDGYSTDPSGIRGQGIFVMGVLAWNTGGSGFYKNGALVVNDGVFYRCIQDNTADASNEPGVGASFASFWVVETDDIRPRGVVIQGNYLQNMRTPMLVHYCQDTNIANNTIKNASEAGTANFGLGLQIDGMRSTNIVNNNFSMLASTLVSNGLDNLLIEDSRSINIIGNTFTGAFRNHIRINTVHIDCERLLISENVFSDPDGTSTDYLLATDNSVNNLKFLDNMFEDIATPTANGTDLDFKMNLGSNVTASLSIQIERTIADDEYVAFGGIRPRNYTFTVLNNAEGVDEQIVGVNNASNILSMLNPIATNTELLTVPLTGTTGTNGKFIASVNSQTLFVENRMGSNRTVCVQITR